MLDALFKRILHHFWYEGRIIVERTMKASPNAIFYGHKIVKINEDLMRLMRTLLRNYYLTF